jgi:hypothetical protein
VENHNEKVSPEFVRKFRADLRALLLKNLRQVLPLEEFADKPSDCRPLTPINPGI